MNLKKFILLQKPAISPRQRRNNIKLLLLFIIMCLFFTVSIIAQEKNSLYYNKKGWEHIQKGDDFRAILSFKEALKMNPRYIKAIIGLGRAYLGTEAFEESLKLFNNALKIEKDNVQAINGIGFAMIGLGRYDDALKYFDMTLKTSEENLKAKYGIAHVYYLMDKTIWAKRKLDNILKINPYHYQSLLLMADIKNSDNRTDESKQYIQKAIDSNNELPDGYIKLGQLYLKEYMISDNMEYLNEAVDEFNKALSIQPDNLSANRSMGHLSLLQNQYKEAVKYFNTAYLASPKNGISLYNLAFAYEKCKEQDQSLNYFVKALKASPSDNILLTKLEDFLVLNDYAIGHPLRVKFSDEHLEIAMDKLKNNLSSEAIIHFQRSLILNPMNRTSRETLRDNYLTHNFYRFYIDELKTLYKIYPEDKYQDLLSVAVIKRRDRLYHKAGYSNEPPPRDVPNVLVLNFWPSNEISLHPDAGIVFANYLTFSLAQSGRIQPLGVKTRLGILQNLKSGHRFLGNSLEKLGEMVKKGDIEKLDYIVFGSYREGSNHISINCELLDFHTGVIINNFTLSENGRDNLSRLSFRTSKRLYEIIPFMGRVLKSNSDNILVNLGLFDGIKPGDMLEILKLKSPVDQKKLNINKKMIFIVDESDSLISSAKPLKTSDFQLIDINDPVFPIKKRRSKLIK